MQNDVVSYFLELVAIDSESLNERGMIERLKSDLEQLGAETFVDDSHLKTGGNAGNLYGFLPGNIDKAPILLCAHVDTVKPGNGIKPIIRDGVIYSDGTTILGGDDKSGVAEIMVALRRLKASGKDHAPIEVLFTISEEIGLLGARGFDKSRLKSSFGYAFDTHVVGEIIIGAPSQKSFKITINGKEAHAGVEPEKGLNAILIASEAITRMPMGRIDPETTCNIGIIKGGTATNIVPNTVYLKGEARSHNPDKLQKLCAEIRKAFDDAVQKHSEKGASMDFICNQEYHSFLMDESSEAVQLAIKALKDLDIPYTTGRTGGGSDANIFNAAGFPMIICGTGMDKVHTVDEKIEIAELIRGTDFVSQLIKHHSEA
ncbi:MAG: M20/M25/M40 family metallo-hydrolase [Candidatus Cloacimonetes bacterium]|jgi:tripeptide aminopeptidase|nr:M20/M25/M40 family metallo-hydrolase [Candidatus Cloacimonadota bacterium]NLO43446.1 M20/M25/M40 family metallo-hydrolase [Candidatus Cloacimonadota bacterium]